MKIALLLFFLSSILFCNSSFAGAVIQGQANLDERSCLNKTVAQEVLSDFVFYNITRRGT